VNHYISLFAAAAILTLTACGGGGNDDDETPAPPPAPAEARFEVSVVNLTNAQPLSPIAVVAHSGEFRVFQVGEAATAGLENLAEGGDNTEFLSESDALDAVITTAGGADPVGPGASDTVSVTVLETELDGLAISVATMLVNTNDAFSGINSMNVGELEVDEVVVRRAIAYDAGTEADTEAAGTIPGPAVGGEGFNAARDDDADRVSMHAGVISNEDGLPTSVLSSQHRFDNTVMEIRVNRVE
jgi:hypothetical protein